MQVKMVFIFYGLDGSPINFLISGGMDLYPTLRGGLERG